MRGLKNKNVLVTGGASGIGHATATRFLEEGCTVCVVDRDAGLLGNCLRNPSSHLIERRRWFGIPQRSRQANVKPFRARIENQQFVTVEPIPFAQPVR